MKTIIKKKIEEIRPRNVKEKPEVNRGSSEPRTMMVGEDPCCYTNRGVPMREVSHEDHSRVVNGLLQELQILGTRLNDLEQNHKQSIEGMLQQQERMSQVIRIKNESLDGIHLALAEPEMFLHSNDPRWSQMHQDVVSVMLDRQSLAQQLAEVKKDKRKKR